MTPRHPSIELGCSRYLRVITSIAESGLALNNSNVRDENAAGNVSPVPAQNTTTRKLLEEATETQATVENEEGNVLEDDAAASFDVFRTPEEIAEESGVEGLADQYAYDYDDYVDESMWADDSWAEGAHIKEADFVDVDAHILCTPVCTSFNFFLPALLSLSTSYFSSARAKVVNSRHSSS